MIGRLRTLRAQYQSYRVTKMGTRMVGGGVASTLMVGLMAFPKDWSSSEFNEKKWVDLSQPLSEEEIEKHRNAVITELAMRAAKEGIVYGWSSHSPLLSPSTTSLLNSALDGSPPIDPQSIPVVRPTGFLAEVRRIGRNISALCRIGWRLFTLGLRFLPILFTYPLVSFFDNPSLRISWCKWLCSALRNAGPCFVKLGQWIATRPDQFPADICAELSSLHSAASTHSWDYTLKTITSSLAAHGLVIDDLFVELDTVPIASGAIAQVYKAKMFDGRQVALKVRHPGIEKSIALDLSLLNAAAYFGDKISLLKSLSLPIAAAEFSRIMLNQVDLRLEAYNLLKFRNNFASFRGVIDFPEPISPFCEDLLIESFCEGVPIQTYMGSNAQGSVGFKKQVAYLGMSCFLKMLIADNFIHADMHPGNLLISTKHTARRKKLFHRFQQTEFENADLAFDPFADDSDVLIPSMYVLDVGLVTELTPYDRESFLCLFGAVVAGDGRAGARLMIERSPRTTPLSEERKQAFIAEIDELLSSTIIKPLNQIPIADTFTRILRIAQHYDVRLEANFVSLMTGIITIEGLARQLDADFNLLEEAKPLLAQSKDILQVFLRNNLTRVAQRARSKIKPAEEQISSRVDSR